MKKIRLPLLSLLLLCFAAPSQAFELTVLHTNDVHSMYGGTTEKGTACYAAQCAGGSGGSVRLKQAVDTVRAAEPNVVLLDAGDEFQGTLFYTQFKGDVAAEVLDALDYTAFTPGNHEFDDGCGEFRRFAERTHVPVLAANLTLPPVPGGKPLTRPWTVVERQGRKIGIVGLVNEETPSYVEFITGEGGVIDTWLRRGAAGFRLDVADELPDSFIEKVRTAVKRVGPDKFLLGEVWEDATTKFGFDKRRTYLLGKGLDSVMNYPFKNAVLGFVCGRDAGQTMTDILTLCEHYPAPALDTALNFLSTHDTERALTVIADEPANGRGRAWQSGRCVTGDAYEEGMLRLRMAYAIIYTLPGVPCLYYGDEIGMQGYRDPFNRGFYCWDSHEERLRPVLAQLAQLRHSCEAFRTGALRVLRAEGGILHYQRIGEAETAEIIVNRTEHIIVEPLASGKHTEVNPMGFTIVVEEIGHNPDHSYYDYQ